MEWIYGDYVALLLGYGGLITLVWRKFPGDTLLNGESAWRGIGGGVVLGGFRVGPRYFHVGWPSRGNSPAPRGVD